LELPLEQWAQQQVSLLWVLQASQLAPSGRLALPLES
jgi:hypothetical protein